MIDGDEERRECFAGARGRGDQGRLAAQDGGPAFNLRFGGGAELGQEPLGHDGVRPREMYAGFQIQDGSGCHPGILA